MLNTRKLLPWLIVVYGISIIPALLIADRSGFDTWRSWADYLGLVTGIVGINLLLLQIIIGARAISSWISPDLARNLKLHVHLGKWGTLLVFSHPTLVVLGSERPWSYLYEVSLDSEYDRHVFAGRVALWLLVTVWVSSAILRSKIKFRPWKLLHYLAYAALPPALFHALDVGPSFSGRVGSAYIAVVSLLALIALISRARMAFGFGRQAYTVVDSQSLSDTIHTLTIEPSAKDLAPNPGQYVYIQPGLLKEAHPFSVLGYDADSGKIHLGFRVYGKFTKKIANLKAGQTVNLDGPYGSFTSECYESQKNVFISGGIGITPFVQTMLNHSGDNWIFDCHRDGDVLPGQGVLSEQKPDRYVQVVNDGQEAPNVEVGYFDGSVLGKYIDQPGEYNYFVCGPPKMMSHVVAELQAQGISDEQIHTEEFSF